MIPIPGEIIAFLTFPGIVLHEISHRFMCDLLCVPVFQAFYFIPGSKTAGSIIHEKPKNIHKAFLISFAPLLINSFACIILTIPRSYAFFDSSLLNINFILYWMGISCGAHAFPSSEDMKGVLKMLDENQYNLLTRFIIKFFCRTMNVFNLFRLIWFNFIYA